METSYCTITLGSTTARGQWCGNRPYLIPKPHPPRASGRHLQTRQVGFPFLVGPLCTALSGKRYLPDLVQSSEPISRIAEPGIQVPLTKPWVSHVMCLNLHLLISEWVRSVRDMPNSVNIIDAPSC